MVPLILSAAGVRHAATNAFQIADAKPVISESYHRVRTDGEPACSAEYPHGIPRYQTATGYRLEVFLDATPTALAIDQVAAIRGLAGGPVAAAYRSGRTLSLSPRRRPEISESCQGY